MRIELTTENTNDVYTRKLTVNIDLTILQLIYGVLYGKVVLREGSIGMVFSMNQEWLDRMREPFDTEDDNG